VGIGMSDEVQGDDAARLNEEPEETAAAADATDAGEMVAEPEPAVAMRARVGVVEPLVIVLGIVLLTGVYYRSHVPGLPWEQGAFRWIGVEAPQGQRLLNWVGINFLLLFCVPAVAIKLVLRRSLAEFGLRWGDARTWGKYFLGFAVVMVPAIFIASKLGDFVSYYSYHMWAVESAKTFGIFCVGWLVYFFAWEFFFRGFLLFGLSRSLGSLAIFVQMVPFVMMHYPKPELESYAAIVAGIALGFMAYRGKSFVGCWLLHWVVAVLMYAVVLLPQ